MQGLIIDNFAGGGGASHGIERALGRKIDVAINHDADAVAMHLVNHPETKHYCQSIMSVDPADACTVDGKIRKSSLWWFSPDCKHHSKAKGGKPRDKNIRDLAWVVVHWIERLGAMAADCIMLENVEEFRKWGPLDEDGYPIKEREGEEFNFWVRQIRRHGYKVEWRELVAANYGAPTTRKRLYLIARRDGQPIVWPEATHKPASSKDGVVTKWAEGQGLTLSDLQDMDQWRSAASCIDWSIDCPSIFDRDRPLRPNTLKRIAHGVMRYVVDASDPFIVPVTNSKWGSQTGWSATEPLRTVTTAKGGEYAVVNPGMVPLTHNGGEKRFYGPKTPFPTVTGANRGEIGQIGATLVGVGGRRAQSGPLGVSTPMPTGTAKADTAIATVHLAPHITKFRGGAVGSDAGNPMPTITANGEPKRPAGAQPLALAGATLVQTGYGEREGQDPRSLDPSQPLGTVVASGGKHAAAAALLSQFRGSNKTGSGGDPAGPAKAITAGGQHQAVICAHMEQANTGMVGHLIQSPLSTIVGSGSTQRLVETTLIPEGDLPPHIIERATQTAAFLMVYYGTDQAPDMEQPMPVIRTRGHVAVVTVTIDAVTYVIVDIGMRMLKPRELARAMGLPDDYVLDPVVTKTFKNKRKKTRPLTISEQISKIGNMVCPDVAEALVRANLTSSQIGEEPARNTA